ncbi:MAG: hypothetical protein GYA23_00810 [Methanomicrobiales archaeon]|nr:hypothetical protein [Methanomicrobiales archaeon]
MTKIPDTIKKISNIYTTQISTEENKKFFYKFFSFVLIIFIIAIVMECYFAMITTNSLNDYFAIKYENEIKPHSETEILKIVNEVKPIQNSSEKLNKIAEWEMRNFTDQFWESYLNHDIKVKGLNPPLNSYKYEKTGKIRAEFLSPYANDPYWIQYYRFGSCGEEASLFANVTNRSGYVTRMVVIETGYWFYGIPVQQNNHVWTEVQINNEWYFFDSTVYGEYHVLKIDAYKNRWFGKTEQYDLFSPNQVLSITQLDTKEDVSYRYPKLVSPYLNAYKILW